MRRISISKVFVNEAENGLIPIKMHTIRVNYNYWKRFEGQDLEFFYWKDKPYKSEQVVVCVEHLKRVLKVYFDGRCFFLETFIGNLPLPMEQLSDYDGFATVYHFYDWFSKYPKGHMAILHFYDTPNYVEWARLKLQRMGVSNTHLKEVQGDGIFR